MSRLLTFVQISWAKVDAKKDQAPLRRKTSGFLVLIISNQLQTIQPAVQLICPSVVWGGMYCFLTSIAGSQDNTEEGYKQKLFSKDGGNLRITTSLILVKTCTAYEGRGSFYDQLPLSFDRKSGIDLFRTHVKRGAKKMPKCYPELASQLEVVWTYWGRRSTSLDSSCWEAWHTWSSTFAHAAKSRAESVYQSWPSLRKQMKLTATSNKYFIANGMSHMHRHAFTKGTGTPSVLRLQGLYSARRPCIEWGYSESRTGRIGFKSNRAIEETGSLDKTMCIVSLGYKEAWMLSCRWYFV